MSSRAAPLLLALLFLSACSPAKHITGVGGPINILSLPDRFDIHDLPDGWHLAGSPSSNQIVQSKVDPRYEVVVRSSDEGFLLSRKTDAVLLATPYLSWRWLMQPGDWDYHPVRLIVGFNGGSDMPSGRTGLARLFPNLELPPHDRRLSVLWGDSALMRGTLEHVRTGKKNLGAVRYILRGGRENEGKWWDETIDLSHLYAKAWPRDNISRTRIVYVGIGSTGSSTPLTANVGDLRLSR